MLKKLFKVAGIALLIAYCQLAAAQMTVSVYTTPSNPVAPANVTLGVMISSAMQVEYFNGTTSLGVVVQPPYTLTLNNLAAGTYQISAKVTTTDPNNPIAQSAPLAVTVGAAPGAAKAYFIHTDQLNTPRAITNDSGNLVWQWDSDPFGKDAPNEQPAGQPAFTFNQRFPGQQFDRETNLHYNYFRDYDPQTGRYVQSDLIGLDGGINTYGYVDQAPLVGFDPNGLADINLFSEIKDGPLHNYAEAWGNWSNVFSVAGHGDRNRMFGPGLAYTLDAKQLARMIVANRKYKPGMPIELGSCNTGNPGEDGKSFAQNLANEVKALTKTDTEVTAPTSFAWYQPNGTLKYAPAIWRGTAWVRSGDFGNYKQSFKSE